MKFGKILSAAALLLSSNLSFAEEVPQSRYRPSRFTDAIRQRSGTGECR